MSPLWGFGYLVYAACYKHSAPLGLNTSTHQNSRHGIHRRGLVSSPDGLGNPTPTHPISLRVFNPVHLLILSILIQTGATCRLAGAKGTNCTKIQDMASIVGARFPCPMGWGTQPLRIQSRFASSILSILIQTNGTCRPAGAKCTNCTKIRGTASIVGAWFPHPMGWGTQPLRIQSRFASSILSIF